MPNKSNWIVVTDFDGTLTKKDVGNELCDLFAKDKFLKLQSDYRSATLNLRDYQQMMWTGFPCSEDVFRVEASRLGALRQGVNEFLEKCALNQIPVYIASCGIRPYIEEVLKSHVSKWAQESIKGIVCNDGEFDEQKLVRIVMPDNDPTKTTPLHKGLFCQDLLKKNPSAKILAIGNGSSDKSFLGYADAIAACDKFIDYCKSKSQKCIEFENFLDLSQNLPADFWN